MPNMAEYNALLVEIAAEWDTAEKNIKAAELVSNQVVFPSIKELRYAGRRIVDFIRAINEGKSDQDIRQRPSCGTRRWFRSSPNTASGSPCTRSGGEPSCSGRESRTRDKPARPSSQASEAHRTC